MNKSEFENINVDHFDSDDNTGWKRSNAAFPLIYNKILETKINISLNFSTLMDYSLT